MAILTISGLRKSFGATEVLKGIDLSVEARELVFIIGPSGSGKSTLLRCINRLEEPSGGRVYFDGNEVTSPATDLNALRRSMGMVFQSFNLYPHMTALGNVTLALRKVLKKPREEADELGRRALAEVGLADKPASYPAELSGGQQQRVAIARALINQPAILLCDEPTGNLDTRTSREIMALFRQLNEKEGLTVILVTHDLEVARKARRALVLVDGEVVADTSDFNHAAEVLHRKATADDTETAMEQDH
jgi:polar amino acid transport system ATP-binding protein